MAMNKQRRTSNINNIITYDTLGNVTIPASFTVKGLVTAGFARVDANGLFSVDTTAYQPLLPSQAGNSGKYLTTDGSVISWGTIASMGIGNAIAGATAGSVLFAGTSGVLQQDNANFFWDDTNNRLGIGTATPSNDLSIFGNRNSPVLFSVQNTNTGTASQTGFNIGQTTTGSPFNALYFEHYGSGYSGSGFRQPSSAALICGGGVTNGMSIVINNNSNLSFLSGNPAIEKIRMYGTTGNLVLQNGGTFADAGYRLDVNGTARVSGSTTFGTLGTGTGMFWDNTNNRLGIGTATPTATLQINRTTTGTIFSGSESVSNTAFTIVGNASPTGSLNFSFEAKNTTNGFGSVYGGLYGHYETVLNFYSTQASAGNKLFRFGNFGYANHFAIQKQADNFGAITGIPLMIFSSTGNVLLQGTGTSTTDAGYRLDVNGTARVSGILTFSNASTGITDLYIGLSDVSPYSGNRNIIIGNTSGTLFTTGTKNVALGQATITSTSSSVVQIGNITSATGANAISIGTSTSSASNSVAIGLLSNVTGANSINISTGLYGFARMAISNDICFAIGSYARGETTASNQGLLNAQNIFIGRPARATSTFADTSNGVATSINGMGGYGLTDATGGNLTINGGVGLGAGASGDVIIGTATPTTTGTTVQTLTDRVWIKGSTGNVGIGTPTPSTRLDIQGSIATDGGQLGAELTTTGSGTNWAGTSFATGYTHTTGSTAVLSTSLAAVVGNVYQVVYTITGRTTGTININFGGFTLGNLSTSGNSGWRTGATTALTITPTTDFNGTIVLSIKQVSASSATMIFRNSSGTITNEIRSSSLNTNNFFGFESGAYTTNGYSNTAIGYQSLKFNSAGYNNVAIGDNSLGLSSYSYNNIGIGASALRPITSGRENVAIGHFSLSAITTAFENVAIGNSAGNQINSGIRNTLLGTSSGIAINSGSSNTLVGYGCSFSLTTGSSNSALGFGALNSNTTGGSNIGIGYYAGFKISGGVTNNTITNNSIYIGNDTKALADNQTNQIVIGYQETGLGSNTTIIGNSSTITTAIRGRLLLGTTTDTGLYQLDVNGTARVSGAISALSFNDNEGYGTSLTKNKLNLYSGSAVLTANGSTGGMSIHQASFVDETVGASVLLSLNSTTRGFRLPRLTTTQKNAIGTPVAGLQVYDSTLNLPSFYNGTSWVDYGNNIYNSNGTLSGNRTVTIGDYYFTLSKTQTGLTGLNDFVGTNIVSAPTTNASIAWSTSKGFFNYQGIFSPTFGGDITFQNSNYVGQELKINRITFASASSTVTMTQGTAGNVRAFSNAILHNYVDGTNNGTITHFATLAMYGDFASSSARFTFTNRYGLLINDFQEYGQGHTYTNRWAIYQVGANDNNYFAGKVVIGSTDTVGASPLNVKNLPTSATGLSTGDIWSNAGVLTVV